MWKLCTKFAKDWMIPGEERFHCPREKRVIDHVAAPPNGMRLSCGADLKISQIEDHLSETAPPASGAC